MIVDVLHLVRHLQVVQLQLADLLTKVVVLVFELALLVEQVVVFLLQVLTIPTCFFGFLD